MKHELRRIEPSSMQFGKLPPQAKDVEEVVLGTLMIDNKAVAIVADLITPDVFYMDAHREIFKAIIGLFNKSEPIDILTVSDKLRSMGELDNVGGPYVVTQLTERVASSVNIEKHVMIIKEKFIKRETIKIASEMIRDAYDDTTDCFEILDNSDLSIAKIRDEGSISGAVKMGEIGMKVMRDTDEASKKEATIGIRTGFRQYDSVIHGFQKSDLIIIAARPSMGKTAFVLNIARNVAINDKIPVAIFSLEMSKEQLAQRLMSSEIKMNNRKFKDPRKITQEEWTRLTQNTEDLFDSPIYIDDRPNLNIQQLRGRVINYVRKYNIQIILIDFLQLMTGVNKSWNREAEISSISRGLKLLAKELNIPVVALSQLNRSLESRSDKKPRLSDLRESGALEQDPDLVTFLYRPEYYGILEDGEGNSLKNQTELITEKNRNGATKSAWVEFIPEYTKFNNLKDMGGDELFGAETASDEIPF